MAKIREIRKRMVAVGNIARITKTMQMIATAKFTAAMARAKATKPYTQKIRQLTAEVAAAAGDVVHPLLTGPATPVNKELLLVISSDRGLCGAFNANILRKSLHHVRDMKEKKTDIALETAGKKAVGFFKFQRVPVVQKHSFGDKPKYDDVEKLASRYMEEFTAGKYDAVHVAYMRFESNSRQIPEVAQLLPLKGIGGGESTAGAPAKATDAKADHVKANYEFSPSSEALLADLLPTTVKASLFQAFNDALVSEQLMRMVAMKSATENAKDLGKSLKRQFNRARQSRITTELTEIVSGAAALE